VLLLTLSALALLLVMASGVGSSLSDAFDTAKATQQRVDQLYALDRAKARALFALATVQRSRKGLGHGPNHVHLDDRPYDDDGVVVAFQDARGLMAINGVTLTGLGSLQFRRFLETYALPPDAVTELLDTLLDYRDPDELKRLAGAELAEYENKSMAAPRNANLLDPRELRVVMGWGEQQTLWTGDAVVSHIHTVRNAAFNPLTGTWRALVAHAGMTEEAARAYVQARQIGDVETALAQAFGAEATNNFSGRGMLVRYPGATTIISLRPAGATWGVKLSMELTPSEKQWPWRIHWTMPLEHLTSDAQKSGLTSAAPMSNLREIDRDAKSGMPAAAPRLPAASELRPFSPTIDPLKLFG
jgi:hypothetical protein